MTHTAKTTIRRAFWIALGITLVATQQACNQASGAENETPRDPDSVVYGAPVKLGNGTARTYIVLAADAPMEIGVTITEAAMTGLQGHHEPGAVPMPDGHSMYEHVLPLPAVNPTPFRTVVLNWNPGGHEPPGIYDAPHFDFHFYTITDMERRAIDLGDPAFERKAKHLPALAYVPNGYVLPDTMGIPQMGVHWIDPTSPEFNGQPFSRTFIYGSWDGQVIFEEPMITKAFLESKPDATFPLPRAERYRGAGYHPTSYTVRWDADAREYRVALTALEKRD